MKRAAIGVVVLAALGAGYLGAVLAPASAQQRARVAAGWEYAELTVTGNDGVFWTPARGYFLEGPDRRDPERLENSTRLSVFRPIRLLHLNAVGGDGWEVFEVFASSDGETYLLRRPR